MLPANLLPQIGHIFTFISIVIYQRYIYTYSNIPQLEKEMVTGFEVDAQHIARAQVLHLSELTKQLKRIADIMEEKEKPKPDQDIIQWLKENYLFVYEEWLTWQKEGYSST